MGETRPSRHRIGLTPARLLTAGEALLTLAAASLAIRLLPFRHVVRAAGGGVAGAKGKSGQDRVVAEARWAIEAWAKRVPWRAVCFQRGLALHLMLRRRGIPSVLHYGVTQTEQRELKAHVWISAGGDVVLGGEEAPAYTCLATFPAALSR